MTETATFQDLRVLLADDNSHMRTIVGTILKSLGVREVREATDGSHALQALRGWPADVAFVDFLMQPMDGVAFTRAVRAGEGGCDAFLPIIMMTGHTEMSRVTEARDAGITEFIVKPLTTKAVLDRLNAVIFKPRAFIRASSYFGPNRRRITAGPVNVERRGGPPKGLVTEI